MRLSPVYWLILGCLTIEFGWGITRDPYEIMGISSSATPSQIKAAYKKLVREWHPDKNTSPEAEEKFIEIQGAYELLSNEDRRREYDRTGSWERAGDTPNHHAHNMDDMLRDMMFGQAFHGGDNQATKGYAKNRITLRMYEHSVLQQSWKKPYLILVYSDWCAPCLHYFPQWDALRQDLEEVGYVMGTVNRMLDGTLTDRLRARSMPSFIALIEGRTYHFRGNLNSKLDLVDFARSVIPTHFITYIKEPPLFKTFVDGWETSNKVSVVMFGPRDKPRLRFLVAAMQYAQFARFAYVHFGQMKDGQALRKALGLHDYDEETLLVFNDMPEAGPVARLSAHGSISTPALRNLVEENKNLVLPRMSSQERFDRFCPASGRPMRLCAMLVVDNDEEDRFHVIELRRYLSKNHKTIPSLNNNRIKFLYMYKGVQSEFINALQHNSTRDEIRFQENDLHHEYKDVVVVWRIDSARARFIWLRNVWSGREDHIRESANHLFGNVDSLLTGNIKLDDEAALQQLVDEHTSSWLHRFSHRTMRVWEAFIFHATKEELLPALSVVGTLGLIVGLGYILNYLASKEIAEQEKTAQRLKRAEKERKKAQGIKEQPYDDLLRELRAETYFGMVRLLKPGCRTIVVLVSQETKEKLLPEFRRCIWPWRKNKTLMFGYVMVEKNIGWFKQLLAHTLPIDQEPTNIADAASHFKLQSINPKQTVGTVLSLNGWRLYFCMYHPKHAPSMVGFRPKAARNSAKNFLGFDDVESTSESETEDPEANGEKSTESKKCLDVDDLLNGLPNWLERLFEGQTRRYYLPEWPQLR